MSLLVIKHGLTVVLVLLLTSPAVVASGRGLKLPKRVQDHNLPFVLFVLYVVVMTKRCYKCLNRRIAVTRGSVHPRALLSFYSIPRKYESCVNMEINKGLDYIRSTPGVLKIFEMIALVVALACMSNFMDALHNSKGAWEFFLFTVATSWVLTVSVFFFFTLGFHERWRSVNWPLAVGIVFLVFSVLLLIASSIITDNARSYKASGLCDAWAAVSRDIDCTSMMVAAIFGFVSFVLYVLDTLLHFWLSVVVERTTNITSEETAEMEPRTSTEDP